MNGILRRFVIAGGFLVILSVAIALPKEEVGGKKKEIRSPAVDNNNNNDDDDFPTFDDEPPAEFSIFNLITGRAGKFISDFIQQIPSTLFKFFSGVVARQPFAKLREEVRNLNISYPK